MNSYPRSVSGDSERIALAAFDWLCRDLEIWRRGIADQRVTEGNNAALGELKLWTYNMSVIDLV
jgi:hypothetical protein